MKKRRIDPESRVFLRVLEWSSALGLGALAAFLFSLKQVNPEVRFVLNAWSAIVLVVATGVSYCLARTVFSRMTAPEENAGESAQSNGPARSRRRRYFLVLLVLGLAVVGGFFHALRGISAEKRWDIAIGAGGAILLVAVVMYFFYRLVRFLEAKGLPEEQEHSDRDSE